MTSWANLGTYLTRLCKSIGGTSYVLRDAGGRHLAPRPPSIDEVALTKARAEMERYLEGECVELDPTLAKARRMILEPHKTWFDQHAAVLEQVVGADFVTKGPGKRYVHRSADLPFIAERYLSSYLLIISFRSVEALDSDGVLLTLGRARSTICNMLGDLPPDGDGDPALANANRLA